MSDNETNMVGKKLRLFRLNRGFTQDDFAKKIGITRRTLSLIETGKTSTSAGFIKKILHHFPKCDLRWLTGDSAISTQMPPYGDTLESRLSRIEEELKVVQAQNRELISLLNNLQSGND